MTVDQEILEYHKTGKADKAFSILVKNYGERLYWHIRRMVLNHDDADDVLQDVLLKVFKNLNSFRADAQLYTWLFRIASNESINFLNKKKKITSFSIDDEDNNLSKNLIASNNIDADAVELKLQMALAALPEKQRLVFNLRYYDEMSYQDMAEVTQTSVGALKASYHHAAKKIEEFLLQAD